MKSTVTYIGLITLCSLYMVLNPYLIEGVANLHSNLILVGIWNGIFVTSITLIVSIRGQYKYTDIFLSALISTLFLFSSFMTDIVKIYEIALAGRLPETWERFYGSKRNVYMAFMLSTIVLSMLYIRFAPTTARKISLAPLIVIFMSLNFYHYYQFFLFSNSAIIEVRNSSLTYISSTIQTDSFIESCKKHEKLKCYEWYDGDKFPNEALIPASHILHEIKFTYEEKPWNGERNVKPAEQGIQSHKDGQIDDTFAPAFWATINYDVNLDLGRHRLAVHDDTGLVYRATVQGGIALAIASFLWMTICLVLLQYHPSKSSKNRSKWLWAIPIICITIFLALNVEPIHLGYPILAPLIIIIFLFPFTLKDKGKWAKISLGVIIVGSHILYSYLMFTNANPFFFSAAMAINAVILALLWLKQTKPRSSSISVFSGSCTAILTVLPLLYGVMFIVNGKIPDSDLFLPLFICVAGYLLLASVVFIRQIITRELRADTAITFTCFIILFILSSFIVFFVTPYSIEYIRDLSNQPIVGGRHILNLGLFDHKILQFYGIVAISLSTFLKLIHYYLNKTHTIYKLPPR